jgi:hypothetical protein
MPGLPSVAYRLTDSAKEMKLSAATPLAMFCGAGVRRNRNSGAMSHPGKSVSHSVKPAGHLHGRLCLRSVERTRFMSPP